VPRKKILNQLGISYASQFSAAWLNFFPVGIAIGIESILSIKQVQNFEYRIGNFDGRIEEFRRPMFPWPPRKLHRKV
jgi:hypothetical protein